MSTIHNSCALLGFKSSLKRGIAKFKTVKSIVASMQGSASTASPIQSRRVAIFFSMAALYSAFMVSHIYLLRHGETEWTISGRHTGVTEVPLTPHGEEEARTLGRRLRDIS